MHGAGVTSVSAMSNIRSLTRGQPSRPRTLEGNKAEAFNEHSPAAGDVGSSSSRSLSSRSKVTNFVSVVRKVCIITLRHPHLQLVADSEVKAMKTPFWIVKAGKPLLKT